MTQPPETLLLNDLLSFLEERKEALSGVEDRQDLVLRAGYAQLNPAIEWEGSAREWCLNVVSVVARHGQTALVGFLAGLKRSLYLGDKDLADINRLCEAIVELSPQAYEQEFAKALEYQTMRDLIAQHTRNVEQILEQKHDSIESEAESKDCDHLDKIFTSEMLYGNTIFVGRPLLRQQLCELCKPGGPLTLLVYGDEKSGKSHSNQLIQHIRGNLRGNLQSFNVAHVDLGEYSYSSEFRLRDIGVEIADQLGWGDSVPEQNKDVQDWIRKFRNWLSGKVLNSGKQVWIVVDSIDKEDLPYKTEIVDLVKDLIELIYKKKDFHLVVLGLKLEEINGMGDGLVNSVKYEEISPINEENLRHYFELSFQSTGNPFEPEVVETAIEFVLNQAPDGDIKRLSKVWSVVAPTFTRLKQRMADE